MIFDKDTILYLGEEVSVSKNAKYTAMDAYGYSYTYHSKPVINLMSGLWCGEKLDFIGVSKDCWDWKDSLKEIDSEDRLLCM